MIRAIIKLWFGQFNKKYSKPFEYIELTFATMLFSIPVLLLILSIADYSMYLSYIFIISLLFYPIINLLWMIYLLFLIKKTAPNYYFHIIQERSGYMYVCVKQYSKFLLFNKYKANRYLLMILDKQFISSHDYHQWLLNTYDPDMNNDGYLKALIKKINRFNDY